MTNMFADFRKTHDWHAWPNYPNFVVPQARFWLRAWISLAKYNPYFFKILILSPIPIEIVVFSGVW